MTRTNDPSRSPRGIRGDFDRLRHNGAATASEMREFVQQLRGKSPDEMLGAVAKSGLAQGIVLSTLIFVLLLVGLTVPFAVAQKPDDAKKSKKSAAQADEEKSADEKAESEEGDSSKDGETADGAEGEAGGDSANPTGDANEAAEKMGITESKDGAPTDPLDNLLDGGN